MKPDPRPLPSPSISAAIHSISALDASASTTIPAVIRVNDGMEL